MEKLGICLDTSVLIEYFRKKNKETSLFYQLLSHSDHFAITSITEFEIRCGINENQENTWNQLLESIRILSFDSDASRIAAQIDKKLKKQRKQLATADLFIAATAIRYGYTLATLNKRHFERVSNLKIIS